MSNHLRPEEIEAVIAGFEIEESQRRHLEGCVVCRAEAARLTKLIEARRGEILAAEPDWSASAAAVMDQLPADVAVAGAPRPRWLRPLLAAAAALVVAVGLGILRPDGTAPPEFEELALEEILAEMDELLSDDSIPGFEIIDPESSDLETFFDNGAS